METPTVNPLRDFLINDFYPFIERLNPRYKGITELVKTDMRSNAIYQQAYEDIRDDIARIRNGDD